MTALAVTDDAVMTAIGDFLTGLDMGCPLEVIQGQINRVAEPSSPDFIVMTMMRSTRLSASVEDWDHTIAATMLDVSHDSAINVQLDFHGPNSTRNALIVTTLWRSVVACDALADTIIQPLYTSDGSQMPFINGEGQFEDRWVLTLTAQSNPLVSTSYPFADKVSVTIEPPVGAEA